MVWCLGEGCFGLLVNCYGRWGRVKTVSTGGIGRLVATVAVEGVVLGTWVGCENCGEGGSGEWCYARVGEIETELWGKGMIKYCQ